MQGLRTCDLTQFGKCLCTHPVPSAQLSHLWAFVDAVPTGRAPLPCTSLSSYAQTCSSFSWSQGSSSFSEPYPPPGLSLPPHPHGGYLLLSPCFLAICIRGSHLVGVVVLDPEARATEGESQLRRLWGHLQHLVCVAVPSSGRQR